MPDGARPENEPRLIRLRWQSFVDEQSSGEYLALLQSRLQARAQASVAAGCRIEVSVQPTVDGSLRIAVLDTGPGIATEHLPRLTERFYRVDRSRSRETGGTGLGLAIVKHVMQRHGGSLEVSSKLGQGSCFALVLPAPRWRAVR